MQDVSARTWVWASVSLQFLGYVLDAVWHGLLNPGVEPTTVEEMVRHLGTVHLPLYIGAASVPVSTSRALLRARTSQRASAYLPSPGRGHVASAFASDSHCGSWKRSITSSSVAPVAAR